MKYPINKKIVDLGYLETKNNSFADSAANAKQRYQETLWNLLAASHRDPAA